MVELLIAQLLGIYLMFALPPVIVAWRRGLPGRKTWQCFVAGVLFGWTLVGAVIAWLIAIDDRPGIEIVLIIR